MDSLQRRGAHVDCIELRDYPIEFCLNCRSCTQQPGDTPGECVHLDVMSTLVEQIERAEAYVLASPTNLGSVTAVFKRFMERLVVYAYWPWDQPYPVYRKAKTRQKKALLISSSAAPGLIGRWFFQSIKQLRMTAKIIGARPVGSLFTGSIGKDLEHAIPAATRDQGGFARAQTATGLIRRGDRRASGFPRRCWDAGRETGSTADDTFRIPANRHRAPAPTRFPGRTRRAFHPGDRR